MPDALGQRLYRSGDLGRFLTTAGEPLLAQTRLDSVFRHLRRLAGLELFLCSPKAANS